MRKIFCDICVNEIISDTIEHCRHGDSFRVTDGVHGHEGDVMYKSVDICKPCQKELIKIAVEEKLGS